MHNDEKEGKAKILAIIASTKYPRLVLVLSVLNTYFKKPDILVGVPKGDASAMPDWQHWSDTLVAKYPHQIKTNNDAPDAVKLIKKYWLQKPTVA